MIPIAAGELLLVAGGGALGSVLRYLVGVCCAQWFGLGFPWGTLAVNVLGSAVIGALGGAMAAGAHVPPEARLFLVTGILGGFTTFSAFSLDATLLWERGEPALAAAYIAGSVILSLAGLWAGLVLVRNLA